MTKYPISKTRTHRYWSLIYSQYLDNGLIDMNEMLMDKYIIK